MPSSTLDGVSGSIMTLAGGAKAGNIFWIVGSAATIDTNSTFMGNILAGTAAITVNGGTTMEGRALALNASVTLVNTVINVPAP